MSAFPTQVTEVSDGPSSLAAASRLASAPDLAVDVEADSMHAFRARLCFVQVGTDEEIQLYDTLAPGVSATVLSGYFADPARTKFFHAAGGDLQFLAEAGVRVRGLFDTHRAVTLLGWPKVGLADLVREQCQVELKKEHQQSDFSIRPLPEAMRDYIADDVRYLCVVGRLVREACRAADILEEVELDCLRMTEEAEGRPGEGAVFRAKIPRQGLTLAQQTLAHALAAALHPLRLQWAEADNVPMGRMLSNAAVHALALKPPANLKELSRAEGVRGAFVRQHGEEVLALVAKLQAQLVAGTLPPLPEHERGDPKKKKREDALKTWRSARATERKVTPSVVLTNPLLDELATTPPGSLAALSGVRYLGEKRIRLYGQQLLDLLTPLT